MAVVSNNASSSNPDITVSTETISGAEVQRVKIVLGSSGTDDGDVASANALPVSASSLPLPSGASTSAKQDTGNTSLSSIDGKITACNTGSIAGAVTANAGTNLNTSALALESGGNLASIHTAADSIDGKITACNTGAIAGSVTANAGTNLNTSLLALEAGGNLAGIHTAADSIDGKITACNTGAIGGQVSTLNSTASLTTGSFTASSQTVVATCAGYSLATFSVSGTYGSVAAAFEGSINGGSTYFSLLCTRVDSTSAETATGTISNTSRMWDVDVGGLTHFRLRSTAWTSGTMAVAIALSSSSIAPAVSVGGSVSVSAVTPGTGATALGKAIDTAVGATDTVVGCGIKRLDALATLTPASGDFVVPQCDSLGRTYVNSGSPNATVAVTPTVSTSPAYTANDCVGGKQTIAMGRASGLGGMLTGISMVDKGNQKAALTIVFFNADPTGTTVTDNSAVSIAAADESKIVGWVDIAASDYKTIGSRAYVSKDAINKYMQPSGSANLFALVFTTGTPTYATTSDLTFNYHFLRD